MVLDGKVIELINWRLKYDKIPQFAERKKLNNFEHVLASSAFVYISHTGSQDNMSACFYSCASKALTA